MTDPEAREALRCADCGLGVRLVHDYAGSPPERTQHSARLAADPDSGAGREGLPNAVSVSVVMPSGHTHTLSHVSDYDAEQAWDCGTVRITVKDGHLVTVAALGAGSTDEVRRLRAVLVELATAAEQVPYHRNPKGGPNGYPPEGHREYSCPLCLALIEARAALTDKPGGSDV